MKRTLILASLPPLLVAAAPSWQKQALASARPFIDRANEEWTRAIISGDSRTLSAPYDEHGIFIGPDGSVMVGKAAVRAMYAHRTGAVTLLKASIMSDGRVAHDPDDVYEWGTARMTLSRNGKTEVTSGKYLTIWHRSGPQWVITRNIAL